MPNIPPNSPVRAGGRWSRPTVVVVAAALIAAAAGCGKPDPFGRQPLKGVVTWNGKPIQFGSISLQPAEGQPAAASAPIRDGQFSMPRESGPCAGKYNVWLNVFDKIGERPDDGSPFIPPNELLPPKFLNKPPAQITIEKVTDEKPNTFEFDLK